MTGGTPHRLIHFTFDDGPDRRTTPVLLNELDRLGIKATFFVTTGRMASVGSRAQAERALLQEIVRRGHRVGNHTVTHRQLPLLTPQEVRDEIQSASDLITEVTGIDTPLVRPPGGSRSPRIDAALASMGYTQVLWNIGSGDFQVRSADDVVDTFSRVLARREREHGERGGIVLMHDTHPWSVAALPRIVDRLKSRNCELLAAGEELFDIVDDPDLFYASGEEDPSALAGPAHPPAEYLAARQQTLRAQTARRCAAVAQN
ncbi:MAG: peptidoglycan/xylan/chitin deacetylase (PgdA/CDA1 family) [Polyangiales bacterium]